MPFTAFHPLPVWLLWMKFPRRFDFVALTVGSVIPDLFEAYFLLQPPEAYWSLQRDWTHSLVGALTLDAVLALAAMILVVRPFLAWADRVRPSSLWNRFAGLDFGTAKPWPGPSCPCGSGPSRTSLPTCRFTQRSVSFPGAA